MNNNIILGIHDGHNCGASISIGPKIIASVSEERLTRKKNDVGFPEKAILEVLKISGVTSSQLSYVAYASLFMHSKNHLQDICEWYNVGESDQKRDNNISNDYKKKIFKIRRDERIESIKMLLGIEEQKIRFVEHHVAHLAAAYYLSPFKKKPILGITCDGAGDGLSATVNICDNNKIKRICEISRHSSIGKIYSRVTYLMGLRPWQDEYKVMGLAPYADKTKVIEQSKKLFNLLNIDHDEIAFKLQTGLSTNYCYEYLKKSFENVRFDVIAGAVQYFTEQMLVKWIKNCINHTKIRDVVCGGGVFMNVKSNMLLGEISSVNSIFFMPTSSDESISMGACLYLYYSENNINNNGESAIENLYLGAEFDKKCEENELKNNNVTEFSEVIETNNTNKYIIEILKNDGIIGLCRGKMEWGARALGNRSIITDPSNFNKINILNSQIKSRDFWMPFAPAIIDDDTKNIFDNKKKICTRFMASAFKIKEEQKSIFSSASHPKDGTIRPQTVSEKSNKNFYDLLKKYKKSTGRSGVLNTSFNLHGEPIVCSPKDAINVFKRSGLKSLALNNFILKKK